MENMAQSAGDEKMKLSLKPLLLAIVGTFLLQLWLCYFFSFGSVIPMTNDIIPANCWEFRFHFPPQGFVSYDYWLGFANYPVPLTPFTMLAHLPVWLLFTVYYPMFGTLAVASSYWLMRELKLSSHAAVIGGLIYGWQGPLLSNIYGGHFAPMALLALTPVAAVMALRAIRNLDWRAAVVCGSVLGMNICLAPDQGMLVALLIGALYLVGIVRSGRRKPREGTMLFGRLLAAIMMSVLVALPALQTTVQTGISGVKQVTSDDPQQHWDWATQWSLPLTETLDYLVPGFFGWRSGSMDGPYWGRIGQQAGWEQHHRGFRNFLISTNSFGTTAFILALAGGWTLLRKRGRDEPTARPSLRNSAGNTVGRPYQPLYDDQIFYGRFFVAVLVICYLLALGRYAPFYWFFYKLPYMGTWRNPMKFMVPGGLCLTVLAAFGTQAMLDSSRVALRRLLTGVSVIAVLILLAAAGASSWLVSPLTAQGYSPPEITAAIGVARLTAFVAALVLGVLWLIWVKPEWGILLLAVSVAGQMYWVHRHYLEPFNFRAAYRTNPLIETIRTNPEPVRVKFLGQDGLLHYYLSAVFPYHRIASVDIPASSRIPEDYLAFFTALQNNPIRLWQLAGVKYLAIPASVLNQVLQSPELRANIAGATRFQAQGSKLDDLQVISVGDNQPATHALVTLKDYLPKATFVPGIEVLPDQAALSRRLAAPDWNPRHTLLFDQPSAASASSDATGTVRLRRYSGSRIEVEAETTAPGYVLINDRFDLNWRATVNNQPVTPFRTDMILYAVPVPAGRSALVLRYQSSAIPVYVHLAALGLTALIGLLGVCQPSSFVLHE